MNCKSKISSSRFADVSLDHLREQKISMVVQVDLKEPEVVESALGVIYEHADSNGIPAYGRWTPYSI